MNHILKPLSLLALAGVIVPCLLFFAGIIDHQMVKWISLLSTIVWFAVTPFWMGRQLPPDAAEVEV